MVHFSTREKVDDALGVGRGVEARQPVQQLAAPVMLRGRCHKGNGQLAAGNRKQAGFFECMK